VAELRLPTTLLPLFAGLTRRVDVEAATVDDAIEELERRWPGLRDRLCESGPSLRTHIHVYVDSERATLGTPVEARSRIDVIAAISGGCDDVRGSSSGCRP
jgi:molybdopterin synthase sulfur carrier subunit